MGYITSFFNKKAAAVLILTALLLSVFAQEVQSSNTTELLRLEEQSLVINSSSASSEESTGNDSVQTSPVALMIRMVLVLVLVIACIYVIVYFLKKSISPGAENDPYLKKTASITLAPGKTVQIVTLQDKAYLLGVSDSSITLISEITDKEFVDSMNINTPMTNGKRPADFASMLASLSGSSKRTENFIKSRRERMKNGEGK